MQKITQIPKWLRYAGSVLLVIGIYACMAIAFKIACM